MSRVDRARAELKRRADAALTASHAASDDRRAAAMRGKARAFREAIDLLGPPEADEE